MPSTRRSCGTLLAATGLLALVLAAPPPTDADVLVLEDGSRLTTDGPWEVRNNLVVFHLSDGTLSSLRAEKVDFETSRAATEEAKRPKPEVEEKEPEPREPVAVLTDADVARVPPAQIQEEAAQARAVAGDQEGEESADAEGGSEDGESEAIGEEEEAEVAGLRVSDWEDQISDDGGTILTGTVRNEGDALATGIRVSITLVGRDGEPVATGQATLDKTTLVPGASTQFRADFPDVFGFGEVRFETGSIPLQYQRGTVGAGQDES